MVELESNNSAEDGLADEAEREESDESDEDGLDGDDESQDESEDEVVSEEALREWNAQLEAGAKKLDLMSSGIGYLN